jgi:hypothetical protein
LNEHAAETKSVRGIQVGDWQPFRQSSLYAVVSPAKVRTRADLPIGMRATRGQTLVGDVIRDNIWPLRLEAGMSQAMLSASRRSLRDKLRDALTNRVARIIDASVARTQDRS